MEKDTHLTDNDGEQPRDNFYHGVISKIFWSNETGVIHSDSGKEVPFIFAFVTLLGAPRQDINFLRPGMRVGFDVGWTSKGLRASTIKIYDLYQDDIVLERSEGPPYPPEANATQPDHPISLYRPPEMSDTAEPPRYRQRRPRPRPQEQELNRVNTHPADQEQKRPEQRQQQQDPTRANVRPHGAEQYRSQNHSDGRPRGQEQHRPEPRVRGQEQRRTDVRPHGPEQKRQESRSQGQRREESPRPLTRSNSGPSNAGPTDMTTPQTDERSRRSRRRRGRR